MSARLVTVLKGIGSLLTILLIVVGVPLVLARIGAVPTQVPDPTTVWQSLTGPDLSGRATFVVMAALVWIFWAAFTLSVLRELPAAVRSGARRPASPLPGLSWPSRPAAVLVAAIVAMFVVAPVLTTAAPSAAAASGHPGSGSARPATVATAPAHVAASHPGVRGDTHPTTHSAVQTAAAAPSAGAGTARTYTVQRHDTVWGIAERQLGDPLRYPEVLALNPGIGPEHTIRPGQTLTLPPDPRAHPGDGAVSHVTVQAGDTLSEIALEHGIDDWHTVWPANAGTAQPDGQHFTNPDHIEPGWDIRIPQPQPGTHPNVTPAAAAAAVTPAAAASGTAPHTAASAAAPQTWHTARNLDAGQAEHETSDPAAAPQTPQRPAAPASDAPTHADVAGPTPAATAEAAAAVPSVVSFAAGGLVLAGGVFAALAAARRRQFRHRLPGRTVAETDPQSIPLERAVVTHGATAYLRVERVDQVLRRLGVTPAPDIPLTHLQDRLDGALHVHFATAVDLPEPWQRADDQGRVWQFPADAPVQAAGPDPEAEMLSPFPTLLSLGADEHGTWLVDLEHFGGLTLTGDPDRCRDLARALCGQLALNPWSEGLFATVVGVGAELADASPARLYPTAVEAADQAVAKVLAMATDAVAYADLHQVTAVNGRRTAVCDETWGPYLLVLAGVSDQVIGSDTARRLFDVLADRPEAAAAAVVLSHPCGDTRVGVTAALDADGRLRLPALDLTLVADQWDTSTAAGVAALLQQAGEPAVHRAPDDPGTQPWQAFTDAAGALREQYVRPRCTPEVHDSADPVSVTSTLPLADEVYQDAGAVTGQDLQLLAPSVPADLASAVRAADPDLDDDVAAWFDPDNGRPKLTLLGPMSVHILGKDPAQTNKHADLIAYLATRHTGATVEEIADRFGLATGTVRKYVKVVRELFGTRPDTGDPYLPSAGPGRSPGGLYKLDGLLVDADLFRRLRVRGQARGAAGHGVEDYATSLRLVSGQPFSRMRSDGWLIQGDRIDLHMVGAIVDVAQIVALNALATDDVATASAAIEIGRQANPYVEANHLDQAAAAIAAGRRDQAGRILKDVIWRSDDELPPAPLSDRTRQILARHSDWLSQAS